MGGGTDLKVEVHIICERNEQEKFWTAVCSLHTRVHIFSASLLTFAPWYFQILWLYLTLEFTLILECKIPWLILIFPAIFPDHRNHVNGTLLQFSFMILHSLFHTKSSTGLKPGDVMCSISQNQQTLHKNNQSHKSRHQMQFLELLKPNQDLN